MLLFIAGFIVVFGAGLVIREIINRKKSLPPEPLATFTPPDASYPTAPAAFCTNCGAKLEKDASFCVRCGAKTI